MELIRLNKDEMTSHLAEIIDSQDSKILTLHQQQRVLVLIATAAIAFNLIF